MMMVQGGCGLDGDLAADAATRRRWLGDVAVVRVGHRTVRIRREDLDAWIASKDSHNSEED